MTFFWPFTTKRELESTSRTTNLDFKLKIFSHRTSAVYALVCGAIGALLVELLKAIFQNWYLLLVVNRWLYITVVVSLLLLLFIVFLVLKAMAEKDLKVHDVKLAKKLAR